MTHVHRNLTAPKHPVLEEEIFFRDGSWEFGDLHGITTAENAVVAARENPYTEFKSNEARPDWAAEILRSHGIQLAFNAKAGICWSSSRLRTCRMSPWCSTHCYGLGVRLAGKKVLSIVDRNALFLEAVPTFTDAQVENVAIAIREICRNYGFDAMRWNGIGDLVPGAVRLLDTITADDPHFAVWGYSRKPDMLDLLPVRQNLVFWASVDPSIMQRPQWLHALQHAVDRLETGLVYATDIGKQYKPVSLQGWTGADSAVPLHAAAVQDELLPEIAPAAHVIFGYHGPGRTTHVSVDRAGRPVYKLNECPGTDPLGGGHHAYGICHQCRWCLTRPSARQNLLKHRKRMTVDDDDGNRRSLHTGTIV